MCSNSLFFYRILLAMVPYSLSKQPSIICVIFFVFSLEQSPISYFYNFYLPDEIILIFCFCQTLFISFRKGLNLMNFLHAIFYFYLQFVLLYIFTFSWKTSSTDLSEAVLNLNLNFNNFFPPILKKGISQNYMYSVSSNAEYAMTVSVYSENVWSHLLKNMLSSIPGVSPQP